MASLVSVNVGMPQNVAWHDKTVCTGVWKQPVEGRRMVRRLNIDGDGQGDRRAMAVSSGRCWCTNSSRIVLADAVGPGRLRRMESSARTSRSTVLPTTRSASETGIASATPSSRSRQPRVTCYRVGLRVGEPELPALLVSHHRPGFYMRVLSEGLVGAGDAIIKTQAGPGALSVADTDALLYLPHRDGSKMRLALEIPALSPGWQQSFRELQAGQGSGTAASESSSSTEPAWSAFRTLRVADVVAETATVSSIYLTTPDDSPLPPAGGPVPDPANRASRATCHRSQLLAV